MILRARTQSAAFCSGHSGQSPLALNHIEPATKIKWDQSREACNWRLPDRMQRNADREMMLGAGRMTATARAAIGARCSSPTVKRGSEVCVQTCDDARQL